MNEIAFQDLMVELINENLNTKKFKAYRGKSILYELKVDEELNILGNPKNPIRGSGAFETDVTVFALKNGIEVPFIVIEVKENISSHDIITYSNKATRHKSVYPYLRYGLVAYNLDTIPKRFFKHNESIDFFLAVKKYSKDKKMLGKILYELVKNELKVFENLQKILHSREKLDFYQSIPLLNNFKEK